MEIILYYKLNDVYFFKLQSILKMFELQNLFFQNLQKFNFHI